MKVGGAPGRKRVFWRTAGGGRRVAGMGRATSGVAAGAVGLQKERAWGTGVLRTTLLGSR